MTQTSKKIKKIVIAGGGTAGWMAASLMHHRWASKGIQVYLVESPAIGIIGVGEGSTPTLKRFFQDLNISESEWMPECNATYKVNIEFSGWSPHSGINSYSHPFISQVDVFSEKHFYMNCLTRRHGLDVNTRPDEFLLNGWLAKQGKSPIAPSNFPFEVEYGYHFDSALLGHFLAKRAVKLGVKHVQAKIENVNLHSESGDIDSLLLDSGEILDADFFVDSTGFNSLLMQKALNVGFTPFSSNLFNDAAVAMPSESISPTLPQTKSTALSSGWAWQIPLTHRTGNGYVYSSKYINKEQAEFELRSHLGLLDSDVEARHLKMNVGQINKHWHKNCLAIGLSQGFIEPLEATALHLTQISIEMFMDSFEEGQFGNQGQALFNKEMNERYERVRDYIVAHYKLNTRNDSSYWVDSRENMKLSESLLQLLTVWYEKGDLPQEIYRQGLQNHFGVTSWHCLLAGYGAFPRIAKNQPGIGDKYKEFELGTFFQGCLLNFDDN
ncbi:MAG: flavin-dependent dehydrogenase [Glaciecola sp.]|jgi:flavin-dependent dehydrogenase